MDNRPRVLCARSADDVAREYVGHRQCSRFGQWAMPTRLPAMFFDWSVEGRSVSLPVAPLPFQPHVTGVGGAMSSARFTAPAITTAFRVGIGLHHAYLAFETEAGGVGGAAETPAAPGQPSSGAAFVTAGYLAAGVRGALGRLSVAGELAGGGRIIADQAGSFGSPIVQGVVEARRARRAVDRSLVVGRRRVRDQRDRQRRDDGRRLFQPALARVRRRSRQVNVSRRVTPSARGSSSVAEARRDP